MHNHRLTPWVSLYRDFCDATSDPVLRQITLKFRAKYLSKLQLPPFESEAKQITRLNKELATIVQITWATGKDRLIGSAVAGSGDSGAELMIVVLQIVVIADVNDCARMRQPCEKRLRLYLLGASQ